MSQPPKSAAIIAGAGLGHRLGAPVPKALLQLDGITLVERAFTTLSSVVDEIIITAPQGFEDQFRSIFGECATVITGGVLRSDSIRLALAALPASIEYVLVHDAARGLASTELAKRVLRELHNGAQAVVPALEMVDTVKEVNPEGFVVNTPDRNRLKSIQTPQGFFRSVLKRAHEASDDATDDAALVEAIGVPVKTVAGEALAMKVTNPHDISIALNLLHGDSRQLRVGVGTDAHAFSTDQSRPLWLATLHWPDHIGVDGHSDGDVAAHAICDALFSASQLGDLGSNFGTSDPKYAGASGAQLLGETLSRVKSAGFSIVNVSVQIISNRPKIGSRRKEAIDTLSQILEGATVSVTATSTDGLGFTGEGKGISAIAIALLSKDQ